jgi:diguanylate cyclase (GGDEF)-like protein
VVANDVAPVDDILLVDDDPATIQLMGKLLAGVGHLRFATSGEAALKLAHESLPDLILLDVEMPGMSGFDVCQTLKADPALAEVPVIFVTSRSGPEFEVSGFDVGAVDFITKPVSPPLVLARVNTQLRVKRAIDELRRVATTDALTGIANRRLFDSELEREWLRSRRHGDPVALLMVDVDHFKRYNDRYGHPAGDTCLRAVGQALRGAAMRPTDFVARYGGEEFAMLLPKTSRSGAHAMAARVLRAVEGLRIAHEASSTASRLTVSVGIGCYDEDSACWVASRAGLRFVEALEAAEAHCTRTALVEAADQALYHAKHAGRAQAKLLDSGDVARDVPAAPDRQKSPVEGGKGEQERAATHAGFTAGHWP